MFEGKGFAVPPSPARVRGPAVGIAAILAAAWTSLAPASAQNTVGYVLDLSGEWNLYAGGAEDPHAQPIAKWQDLPAGGVLRISTPATTDFVTIADRVGVIFIQKSCRERSDCATPVFLPSAAAAPDGGVTVLNSVWKLLWGDPYQQSLHRVRGLTAYMGEGVAQISDGKASLRPIMQSLAKGTYSLASYGGQGGVGTPFQWDPASNDPVTVGSEAPGLYEIALVAPADKAALSKDVSLRVLLCAPPQYNEAATSFDKAKALTASWGSAASRSTVHAFLRAYLAGEAQGGNACAKML